VKIVWRGLNKLEDGDVFKVKFFLLLLFLFLQTYLDAYEGCQSSKKPDGTKSKIDVAHIQNDASRESMERWLAGGFALEAYKVNYLLPFGYANKHYLSNGRPVSYQNIEAALQVSLKRKIVSNLFGLHGVYYLAYSHESFWQLYTYSAPFRETDYNPEGFVVFPVDDEQYSVKIRSLKFALAHKSNGQPNTKNVYVNGEKMNNLSKSINYIYSTMRMQRDTLIIDFTVQMPLGTGANLSDNPDIMDYLGYNKIKFTYFYKKSILTLMGRGNPRTLRGAVEATYSYPLRDETNLYIKFFSGYGESLIDYNHNITKFSVGFSFSR